MDAALKPSEAKSLVNAPLPNGVKQHLNGKAVPNGAAHEVDGEAKRRKTLQVVNLRTFLKPILIGFRSVIRVSLLAALLVWFALRAHYQIRFKYGS